MTAQRKPADGDRLQWEDMTSTTHGQTSKP